MIIIQCFKFKIKLRNKNCKLKNYKIKKIKFNFKLARLIRKVQIALLIKIHRILVKNKIQNIQQKNYNKIIKNF